MTARSTRNKMKWQAEKVMNDLDRAVGHLKYLTEMSEGQSDYIINHVPRMVVSIEMMKQVIKAFREGL